MKQQIAQKISDAILDWRDGDSKLLVEFPIAIKKITKIAQEKINKKVTGKHLGCRIIFAVTKRNNELTSPASGVLAALIGTAYDDIATFDYLEIVRVKADSLEEECITVEIVEITPKREAWI